jgi:hypothetical protein
MVIQTAAPGGRAGSLIRAVLLESAAENGCLALRVQDLEGLGEVVLRCNADEAGLGELRAAAERCLDALGADDAELGAGD